MPHACDSTRPEHSAWVAVPGWSTPCDGARLARSARGAVQGRNPPWDGTSLACSIHVAVQSWSTPCEGARLTHHIQVIVQGWNAPCGSARLARSVHVAVQGWSTPCDGTACAQFTTMTEQAHVPHGCWCKVCTPSDGVSFARRHKVMVQGALHMGDAARGFPLHMAERARLVRGAPHISE